MQKKVLDTIEKYNMIKKGERVLVGLSGGADSVSLLLCLKELGFNVFACHINHQLRGLESDRDEKFCIELCNKYDVELFVHKINVKKYCNENSLSIEEGARKLRYEIFEKSDFDKIATAHSINDCFETTIFNLARGTGLKGLCSIPPMRNKIIRPLIECSRDEIEMYLKGKNQDFIVDSTNLSVDYNRNKIRHQIMPVLSEINSSLLSTFANSLENLKSDENFIEIETEKLYNNAKTNAGFNIKILCSAHSSIKNRCIARILSENNLSYNNKIINEISDILENGEKINLSKNIYAICKDNLFFIAEINECDDFYYCKEIDFDQKYIFSKKEISFEILENNGEFLNINKRFTNCCLDYDKIKGRVWLRNRKNGDKIKLCNRNFTSSLKKLFNDKIPKSNRNEIAILEDENGIIFVEEFGCADRVKIDCDTKHILIFKVS